MKDRPSIHDSVFNLLPDVWYLVTTSGELIDASQKLMSEFGCQLTEVIGQNLAAIFNCTGFDDLHQRTLDKGQVVAQILDIKNQQGKHFIVSISTSIVESKDGKHEILGSMRNITDHVAIYREQQDSLLSFVDVINSSLDGMMIIDIPTRRVLDANDKALEIFGYTLQEIKSIPIHQAALGSETEMIEFFEYLLKKGEIRIERKIMHKNGDLMDVELSARMMQIGEGNLFQCNIRDITLKKRLYKINKFKGEVLAMKEFGRTMTDILVRLCTELDQVYLRRSFGVIAFEPDCDPWIFGKQTSIPVSFQHWLIQLMVKDKEKFNFLRRQCFNENFETYIHHLNEDEGHSVKYMSWSCFSIYKGVQLVGSMVVFNQSENDMHSEELESIGQLIQIIGNVYQKIEQEKLLLNSENRYRELVDNSPMAIGVYVEGKIEFANQEFYNILKLDFNKKIGAQDLIALVPPDQMPEILKLVDQIREQGQIPITELTLIDAGGDTFTIMLQGTVVSYMGRESLQFVFYDISDRKKIEMDLKESREKFRLAAQGANAGISDHDLIANKMWWSSRMYELMGYEEGEIEASIENFRALLHPDDLIMLRSEIAKNETKYSIEYRLRLKNGEYRWFQASGQGQKDEQGNTIRRVGILVDIHQRKVAENQVRDRERLLNTTGMVAKVGGWQIDKQNRILKWTDQTFLIYGLDPRQDISLDVALSFYNDQDSDKIKKAIDACFAGEPFEFTFRFTSATGKELWVDFSGIPVYEEGEIVKIVGAQRDLTHYIHQIEGIREKERKLVNANHLAQLGNWEWYLDSNTYYWSEELYRILGVKASQKPTLELLESTLLPGSKLEFAAMLQRSLVDEVAAQVELQLMQPNTGLLKYISVRAINARNEKGKVVRVFGTVQDITDRKQVEIDRQQRALYSNVVLGLNAIASNVQNDCYLTKEYCKALVEQVGFDWVWIADVESLTSTGFRPESYHFSELAYKTLDINTVVQSEIAEPALNVIKGKKMIAISEISHCDQFPKWKKAISVHGFQSYISIPYFQGDQLKGGINLYSLTKLDFTDSLEEFLFNLADDYAKSLYAIHLKKNRDELNEYNKLLLDSLDVVSISYDLLNKKASIFGNTQNLVGYDSIELEEMLKDFRKYVHPNDLAMMMSQLDSTIMSGGNFDVDFRIKRHDNRTVWINSIGKVYWEENALVRIVGILINTDEKKQQEMNQVKAQMAVRDNERIRIARSIHDSLGQTLTIACMSLDAISDDVKKLHVDRQELYHDAYKLLNEAIEESRTISHNLMPSILMDFGLVKSIRSDITKLNRSGQIQFDFEFDEASNRRFDQEIEVNLYNITREAVKNILKHSQATQAKLEISLVDQLLTLKISDNGVGLDPNIAKSKDGLGLGSIESRAISIGAEIYISGEGGCSIHIELEVIE
ncbi:PAS domain-containing protein [Reichenbachiella agarivorans]|uniref:histidine kinase n=1 Tax=Reichenbachiella agarivorans TaxID=2979464 RepID=A0ABY6CPY5_9BACT|nr:PAS domain-containing protein [Reichenbachiella agarivorans]UXP32095.1 PAS domain-containing protein [Reichenbachiella agarivorans]